MTLSFFARNAESETARPGGSIAEVSPAVCPQSLQAYVGGRLRDKAQALSAERLRALVNYDPLTGVFTRRVKERCARSPVGAVLGYRSPQGYVRMRIAGYVYEAHRLAWLHQYGEWPKLDIDHINCDRADNRIANLRDVCRRVNAENQRTARARSSTGMLGVSKFGERFRAVIDVDGLTRHLGLFDTAEAAHRRYVEAKRMFHEGCTLDDGLDYFSAQGALARERLAA